MAPDDSLRLPLLLLGLLLAFGGLCFGAGFAAAWTWLRASIADERRRLVAALALAERVAVAMIGVTVHEPHAGTEPPHRPREESDEGAEKDRGCPPGEP